MTGIDWTPVTTALVSLIAVIITTFIPLAIKLFFDMQSARLAKLKTVVDNNQAIVAAIVTVIQQTMGALANNVKYQIALQRVDEVLNLPSETAHDMIELAVAEAQLAWGDAWTELALPPETPAVPPTV